MSVEEERKKRRRKHSIYNKIFFWGLIISPFLGILSAWALGGGGIDYVLCAILYFSAWAGTAVIYPREYFEIAKGIEMKVRMDGYDSIKIKKEDGMYKIKGVEQAYVAERTVDPETLLINQPVSIRRVGGAIVLVPDPEGGYPIKGYMKTIEIEGVSKMEKYVEKDIKILPSDGRKVYYTKYTTPEKSAVYLDTKTKDIIFQEECIPPIDQRVRRILEDPKIQDFQETTPKEIKSIDRLDVMKEVIKEIKKQKEKSRK